MSREELIQNFTLAYEKAAIAVEVYKHLNVIVTMGDPLGFLEHRLTMLRMSLKSLEACPEAAAALPLYRYKLELYEQASQQIKEALQDEQH